MKLLIAFLLLPSLALTMGLEGNVVGISDGDTVTLLTPENEQIRVRLAQIDAPEDGQAYANASRQALADKVFRKDVTVEEETIDRYGRVVGTLWYEGRDINRELVREGQAWVYREYLNDKDLLDEERAAKAEGRGLWKLQADQRVAPWEWRLARRASRDDSDDSDDSEETDSEPQDLSCGDKTRCGEMESCAEAKFYLNRCGASRLDGDNDGVPCEAICE